MVDRHWLSFLTSLNSMFCYFCAIFCSEKVRERSVDSCRMLQIASKDYKKSITKAKDNTEIKLAQISIHFLNIISYNLLQKKI